jgi:Ca2+-binding EF-hand superfamily protein
LPSESDLHQIKESLNAATFSFADLLAAISKLPVVDEKTLRAALMDAFRVFDQAGSGEIGTAQLQHIMTSLGEKLSEEEAQEMVKMADPAGSGVVRYEVFVDKLVSQ